MRFRGQIQSVHMFPDHKALVLTLTNIESTPEVGGMFIRLMGETKKIIELGRNSTDGNAVSYRDCLTGKPVPAYGSIGIDWHEPHIAKEEMFGEWLKRKLSNDTEQNN